MIGGQRLKMVITNPANKAQLTVIAIPFCRNGAKGPLKINAAKLTDIIKTIIPATVPGSRADFNSENT